MSNKNKSIEVTVEEVTVGANQVSQVLIGKKVVGSVEPDEKRYVAVVNGERFRARSLDEGIELVLRQYHLHQ